MCLPYCNIFSVKRACLHQTKYPHRYQDCMKEHNIIITTRLEHNFHNNNNKTTQPVHTKCVTQHSYYIYRKVISTRHSFMSKSIYLLLQVIVYIDYRIRIHKNIAKEEYSIFFTFIRHDNQQNFLLFLLYIFIFSRFFLVIFNGNGTMRI